ncbi:carbon storage regulator [Legionella israelensis]|uniref:Translational regulator CsrA n=1 Tax=Legionella israelensis TaxID=454 RepID=A0AAX1EHT4_9GAMM|nr:carbon storage regulator [Legionella israelensis]QBR84680.1 carbon storage regulator [Legionella israelensis]
MLILFRRVGEQIYIDNGRIKIEVLKQNGDDIAIGIKAPASVDVHRKEVFMRNLLNGRPNSRLPTDSADKSSKEPT